MFGQKLGREVFPDLCLSQFGQIIDQLSLRVSPREIGIGLAKSRFGETVHHLGPGEGLGKKDHSRVLLLDAFDQPLPEGERFGMGIVNAEDADAPFHPEEDDIS